MKAEDIFWFNEPHLERIGEEGRKKLIKLIEGMNKEPKPNRMTKDQEQRAEFRKRLQRLI